MRKVEGVCWLYGSGEALWQVLRMYDLGSKLLNGFKNVYQECIRVKLGETRFYHVPLALQFVYGCIDGGGGG